MKVNIESESKKIQSFVDKGNYHAAYNIALSGLNACRRNNDQAGSDRFIDIIRGVVESLAAEFGSQTRLDIHNPVDPAVADQMNISHSLALPECP